MDPCHDPVSETQSAPILPFPANDNELQGPISSFRHETTTKAVPRDDPIGPVQNRIVAAMSAIGKAVCSHPLHVLEGVPAKDHRGKHQRNSRISPCPDITDPFGNIEGAPAEQFTSAKLALLGERHRIEIKGKYQLRRFPEGFESLHIAVGDANNFWKIASQEKALKKPNRPICYGSIVGAGRFRLEQAQCVAEKSFGLLHRI